MKTSIEEVHAILSVLSPETPAFVMSGSSALLAINALMLKWIKLVGRAAATIVAQVQA